MNTIQRTVLGVVSAATLALAASGAQAANVTVTPTTGGSTLTAPGAALTSWSITLATGVTSATFAASAKLNGTSVIENGLTLTGPSLSSSGSLTTLPGGKSQFLSFPTGLAAGTYTLTLGSNVAANLFDYKVVTNIAASNLTVTQVPEPAGAALGLAGAGVVGLLMRRRRTGA